VETAKSANLVEKVALDGQQVDTPDLELEDSVMLTAPGIEKQVIRLREGLESVSRGSGDHEWLELLKNHHNL
jgi:hypothetical protein